MKMSTDQTKIYSRKKRNKYTTKKGVLEAVFMPFYGENRCAKCCYSFFEKKCLKAPCTSEERIDGETGYFRQANCQQVESHIQIDTNYTFNE